jgi:hypothetical protein
MRKKEVAAKLQKKITTTRITKLSLKQMIVKKKKRKSDA